MKNLILGVVLIALAQIGAWIQQFAQVKWPWFKDHTWLLVIFLGIPVSYLFIWGAQYLYLDMGSVWGVRLTQFSIGMFTVLGLTYFVMGESLSLKNLICVILATIIVLIQSLWR